MMLVLVGMSIVMFVFMAVVMFFVVPGSTAVNHLQAVQGYQYCLINRGSCPLQDSSNSQWVLIVFAKANAATAMGN
ncbi:hypothetical protein SB912_33170, partial [Pantoea sp. SIMBA_072]